MKNKKLPTWKNIHTIIFDFDGIFTNNKVIVDQNGTEYIVCDRGDGLGFDLLRAFSKLKNWEINLLIISKEKNNVLEQRAQKLNLNCVYGISNKKRYIDNYFKEKFPYLREPNKGLIYLGNDLNDLSMIRFAGFSIAPNDAHEIIKKEADLVINKNGGDSFIREFIEEFIELKSMSLDEIENLLI